MTPETAWAEAMKFENRPNPYPFFDELRKTPVAHVGNGVYVVTGYRELMTLAHDPRISSDMRRLKARAAAAGSEPDPSLEAYGEHGSYDRVRPARARSNAPPGDAALRPSSHARSHSEDGDGYQAALRPVARPSQGQDQDRHRGRLRLSGAGDGDLQDLGCSAEGRTPISRLDKRLYGGPHGL